MAKKTGLGRGLDSLFGETKQETKQQETSSGNGDSTAATAAATPHMLPLDKIHRNIYQPRTQFDSDELDELAESIKSVGILQPILVRADGDQYQIIAGERRYQAAHKAGLTEVPVIIKEVGDKEVSVLALIENIQRSNLNSIEEARAYKTILKESSETQESLAARLSKSRSAITNTMRLLELPDEVQDLVFDGSITAGHARALLSLDDAQKQIKLAYRVVEAKLSVRQTEDAVKRLQSHTESAGRQSKPAYFKDTEKRLASRLGMQVKLRPGTKTRKASIEISFADDGDLERILELLGDRKEE